MPQITPLKKLKQSRAQCVVTFTEDEAGAAEAKAVDRLGERIRVEGFRPGRAPKDVLRQKIDPEALKEETVRMLLPPVFEQILKPGELHPIIAPAVELTSRSPLTLTLTFVERPEVKVKGADKIRIEKKAAAVEQKDIDRMTDYLRSQYRTTAPADRPAQDGDQLIIDFAGTAGGKDVEGAKASGYRLVLGSKTLIPGFEEALIGLKKGDAKTFTLTFPADYHAEHLRGVAVEFQVTVQEVEQVAVPAFTDAFVKEHHLGASSEDLRKKIGESLRGQREQEDRQRRENELFDAIRERTQIDLAPELVANEERAVLEDLQRNLEREKLSFEEWLQRTGKTMDQFRQDMVDEGKKRLTLRFAIQWLIKERAIDATAQELDAEREMTLAGVPEKERSQAEAYYKEGGEGFEELKWRKKVEKLVEGMLSA